MKSIEFLEDARTFLRKSVSLNSAERLSADALYRAYLQWATAHGRNLYETQTYHVFLSTVRETMGVEELHESGSYGEKNIWYVGLGWFKKPVVPARSVISTRSVEDVCVFLDERVSEDPRGKVKASVLYAAYVEWTKARGQEEWHTQSIFGRIVSTQLTRKHGRDGVWYVGIRLLPPQFIYLS